MRSVLFDCVPHDHYCVTCVRGLSEAEVLVRLGVADQAPYPRYTAGEALERFGYDVQTVRVHREGDWIFLVEPSGNGDTFQPQILTRLSQGTEAVSALKYLDGTAMAAHAGDGELLATYVDWTFTPAGGMDPSRLNRALTDVGFFREENEDSGDWAAWEMVLVALEHEFGLTVSPDVANGPLPTVVLPHTKTPQPYRDPLRRRPTPEGWVPPAKAQSDRQTNRDDGSDAR
jgi:hypothetical protein